MLLILEPSEKECWKHLKVIVENNFWILKYTSETAKS